MKSFPGRGILAAVILCAMSPAGAQQIQRGPHIGYAYPAGGQQGTSFDVIVGGQYLSGASAAHISGGGARATVSKTFKHLTRGEFNTLRRKLDEARLRLMKEPTKDSAGKRARPSAEEIAKEAGFTQEQLDRIADYRKTQADPKRQPNPQLMEEVTLHVTLTTDAQPGERELRLMTSSGISNPVFFHVGQLTECTETEPNDKRPDPVVDDKLPVVINGQITPGDIDRLAFHAHRGTRLVIAAAARELIPYLADAVPGWFQAVLTLRDAAGKEVAFANAFGYHQDPVIYYEVFTDGEYVVEIRDALYRGREDFVYRITLGQVPYITGTFPLGGRAGTQPTIELAGWNLPVDKLKVDAYYDRGRPIRFVSVRDQARLSSNRVPFAVDMLSQCLEQEPNNGPQTAQSVTLPIIVDGRIDAPGECDVFRFPGRAREKVVAEVYARRLGSPLDSLLDLTDADGHELAFNDDYEDKGAALLTHQADSRIMATLPTDGTYFLRLRDAQHNGGPAYAYRFHIGPPHPDFELRVVPSSVIARAGATVPITVYALRRDGFSDDIALELEKPPAGFRLDGAWMPAGEDKIRLTLTVPSTAPTEPISLDMVGRWSNRTRKLSHPAIPTEAMMQAFAYEHLVPAKDWTVAVIGRGRGSPLPVELARDQRLKLPAGGTAELRASVIGRPPGEIRLELSEPPAGVSIQQVSRAGATLVVVLATDAEKVKPGMKGNLIFNVFSERAPAASAAKSAKMQRAALGTLPAVPFEVVKRP